MSVREPVLNTIAISDLRPTQITVGMREVDAKRQAWKAKLAVGTAAPDSDQASGGTATADRSGADASGVKAGGDKSGGDKPGGGKAGGDKAGGDKAGGDKAGKFLGSHMIPVILGPKSRRYVIDHHHLCRALQDEGQDAVLVNVVANLSALEPDAFWFAMDCRGWMHPFDEHGVRRGYQDIPKSVAEMRDDPFRSLAGELRFAGGYAKDTTPFSEFLWADFLRRRIKPKVLEVDFAAAVAQALGLAKSEAAAYLPGWCGPSKR